MEPPWISDAESCKNQLLQQGVRHLQEELKDQKDEADADRVGRPYAQSQLEDVHKSDIWRGDDQVAYAAVHSTVELHTDILHATWKRTGAYGCGLLRPGSSLCANGSKSSWLCAIGIIISYCSPCADGGSRAERIPHS